MNGNEICVNCKFGCLSNDELDPDIVSVECRYHAPQIIHGDCGKENHCDTCKNYRCEKHIHTGSGWSDTKWPNMDSGDWCGKFEQGDL